MGIFTLGTLWKVVMRKGSPLAMTEPSSEAQVSPLQQATAPSTPIPSQDARYLQKRISSAYDLNKIPLTGGGSQLEDPKTQHQVDIEVPVQLP